MVLNTEIVERILAVVEGVRSEQYTASAMDIPQTTIRRAIQRYRDAGLYTRAGSAWPRATSQSDDCFLVLVS